MTVNEDWATTTLSLAASPHAFTQWQTLIEQTTKHLNKASPSEQRTQFRLSYDSLLRVYPFLERYWIDYAMTEWRLGETDRCLAVFERGISVAPSSNLIWLKYLEWFRGIESNYDKLLVVYERAESHIGTFYHSYEFWRGYLELIETFQGKNIHWFNLLKKIIEIPIYNYAYFFQILFDEIDAVSDKTILLMVSETELQKKLKIDTSIDLKRLNYRDIRGKLKKTYTDAYITTQFQSYELYQFEKGVKLEYFVPGQMKSFQELSNWDDYLSFMELNGTTSQIRALYRRAVVPTAQYPNIWLKFADYYIHGEKIQDAKSVLYQSLIHLSGSNIVPVQLKLVKMELSQRQYLKARDLLLNALSKNEDNVELLLQLINVEWMMQNPEFSSFVESMIKSKESSLAVTLLREVSTFTDIDLSIYKDQLKDSDDYWVLYLTRLVEEKDMEEVLVEYKKVKDLEGVLASSDKIVQWGAVYLNEPVGVVAGGPV